MNSSCEESFNDYLLEYPQYTRPAELFDHKVPAILLSGHHQNIATYRRQQSLATTFKYRPDLLKNANLTAADADFLKNLPKVRRGRNLSFCLVHHPVKIEGRVGTSSLTNLDIHDIARISASYGLGPFYVVMPVEEQIQLLHNILRHWQHGKVKENHADRSYALSLVRQVPSIAKAIADATENYGKRPFCLVSSANWPHKNDLPLISPKDVLQMLNTTPCLVLLGTAQGLAKEACQQCDAMIRPLRFLGYNHLSVRSAAAILADRILGDFD